MKFRIEVAEGARIPNGYGFAWRCWERATTVGYPIPVNIILHYLRRLWHWALLANMEHSNIDKIRHDGYKKGLKVRADAIEKYAYKEGLKAGREEVIKAIEEELNERHHHEARPKTE